MIEWTGLNLYEVMKMNIYEFLNLTLFNIDYMDFQRQEIEKIKRKK